MSKSEIWFDLCRKMVSSIEEGRAIVANPALKEMMRITTEASIASQRAQGYDMSDISTGDAQLVANTSANPILAPYPYFIQVLTTAIRTKREDTHAIAP